MKIRKRELARPGVFGASERPLAVTKQDLREIAATFGESGAPPVILGHDEAASNPRLGYVAALSLDEKTGVLSGDVVETDALSQAVDEGYFPSCSIGAYRRAIDGKLCLRHLAYLGEQPPAIKDLKAGVALPLASIAAADPSGALIAFPPSPPDPLSLSDGDHPHKEEVMTEEELKAALEEAKKKIAELEARKPEGGAELEALKEENKRLKERLAEIARQYPEANIALADNADPRLEFALKELRNARKGALLAAAGRKIPKAKEPLLARLADSLQLSESIELSEGAAKRNVSQFGLLQEIFAALPDPVKTGAMELGDGGGAPVNARDLMAYI
jgi:hypothetical protein